MSSLSSINPESAPELFPEAGTLVELLRLRAALQPGGHAYTFLTDDGASERTLTYAALERQARAIAARLQATVAPGDRVLLLYPPGLGYIAAFFGCLYAGAVAVPAYPPRNNRNLLRLQTLAGNARAAAALTTTTVLSRIGPQLSEHPYLKPLAWLASEEIEESEADGWREPGGGGESVALLQYTSGSTSSPKGVIISHRNLLHNERMISRVFGQTAQSLVVGWLPLYHDMGLIGNVIQPLFVGAPAVLMSPAAFLQKPLRWLEAITRYRATTSGGPNFAYELCARKITDEQREALDLSSWRVAFNGAEPIRGESLERFAEVFGPCGFRRDAFQPCYGLAEATLIVSGRSRSAPLSVKTFQAAALEHGRGVASLNGDATRTLVGCGSAVDGQEVVVVDPETLSRCEPGRVGEIWVSGPSVAQGYWGQPEETERTFQARLAGSGEGPYLRTGDLGFLLGSELFVTGRLKDLIIIRGLNHYPHDIELTAERSHPSLRPGCGAAFSVEAGGEERLVVVQEVEHRRQFDAAAVIESISEAITSEHEVQAHALLLVKPGAVPKTSSGKIQRYACREAFLRGTLDVLAERRVTDAPAADGPARPSATPDPLDAEATGLWLRAQVGAKLGLDPQLIELELPIARYGLDSLAAVELAHAVEVNLGVTVPLTFFLQDCSVAEIAARVRGLKQTGADSPSR
ncbi:MAG: AMP-binding protein, partial [Pyrinomonadaceae bacterium]